MERLPRPDRLPTVRPMNDLREVPASRGNPRLLQPVKVRQQWIVLVEVLAETEAGIEHDALALDAAIQGALHAIGEIVDHQRRDVGLRAAGGAIRPGRPRVCISTTPHSNSPQVSRHGCVPLKGAHVVHDFGTGFDGTPGHARFVGIDGDDGIRPCLQHTFDHRHDTPQLFVFSHNRLRHRRSSARTRRPGTRGFASDVEDVGAFVEQLEGVSDALPAARRIYRHRRTNRA